MTDTEYKTAKRPKPTSSLAEKELDKAAEQFDAFNDQVKTMTLDRMNMAPKQEMEPQVKMSVAEQQKALGIWLKPSKQIGSAEKFNEKFRADYEYDKEYVNFIAENHEIIGENIEMWTKPYPGVPAQYWEVPTNKPIWGPRFVAEQIKSKSYHRLKMQQSVNSTDNQGNQYYGTMAVDTTVQRLDARPVTSSKSIFISHKGF